MSDRSKLEFSTAGTEAATFQYSATSARPFADVVSSLETEIDRAGLKLLYQIDVQQALAGTGRATGGFKLMFFFHPTLVIRVISADIAAMVEAPLKLAVAEMPDGTVALRMAEPSVAFGRYGNAALSELGTEMSATIRRIIGASIG